MLILARKRAVVGSTGAVVHSAPPTRRPRSTRPARISHIYQASPTAVFDAWITPSILRQWLFVGPTSQIVKTKLDLRVGGDFSILERASDGEIAHFGSYVEIFRPHRLAFTLEVPRHFLGMTYVMVRINEIPGGTELVLTQDGVLPEVAEPSWRAMLSRLAETLPSSDAVSITTCG
jgi:uncharacterized protein YndB with AHSA1/START domain